ncbi:DNA ligase [Pseudomonas phage phiPMW]|uniref:DNA ligase n=1 Tax=Pseudomonas phage phiPMW TaxID=1815582 RepID=A0A1S5R1C8_9CAUD|nr:ATP-dependent DNA ligase [Pseudomonas phage phiPMW]ANA49214.1 DNA ligase [Pseudomonas phage phiPMW]
MFEKTLYGLNKGGDYKVWSIKARDIDGVGVLNIAYGVYGGTIIDDKQDNIKVGKQGRTPYEQAVFEAQSRIKKQLDKNYRETFEELNDLPVLAMLSKDHTKAGKQKTVEEGVYTSDKLDGFRCIAKCLHAPGIGKYVSLFSRTGQLYRVPHIEQELLSIMEVGDILDGELYVHGPTLQEISSAVKREDAEEKVEAAYLKAGKALNKHGVESTQYKSAWADYEECCAISSYRDALQYHVFDIVLFDMPFEERLEELRKLEQRMLVEGFVVAVQYKYADSIEELNTQLKDCIDRGFEGIMYRTKDGEYESGKRSSGLWKYKLMQDAEFEILDVIADKQGDGIFVLKNDMSDLTFNCVMGSLSERRQFLENNNELVGKYLTVAFQARYKGTLLPQFPVGKLVRDGYVKNGKFIPTI